MTKQTLVTLERINSIADSIIERVIEEKAKRLLATISYKDFQWVWGSNQVIRLREKYFDLMTDLADSIEDTFMTDDEVMDAICDIISLHDESEESNMEVENVRSEVLNSLNDDTIYSLSEIFAGTDDYQQIANILTDQLEQAVKGADQFNLTVQEYLIAMLEDEDKIKDSYVYDNEEQAEKDGFYWMDEIEKWVQLLP